MLRCYIGKNNVPRGLFEMRAQIFATKLNWDVKVTNGCEIDEFDHERTIYLTSEIDGQIYGSLRLLSTQEPHMMDTTFSQFFPEYQSFKSPLIWECTRFCIDTNLKTDKASSELMIGICDFAMRSGIRYILGIFEKSMLGVYKKNGLPPRSTKTG